MSLITIDQLLESVDLDFEPRWVTKDKSGEICIWDYFKPYPYEEIWNNLVQSNDKCFGELKLAEFEGKDWTECIYEVPRWDNPDGQILKLQEDSYYNVHLDVLKKINELVDAVNELKGAKNE